MQKWEYMLVQVTTSYGINYRCNNEKMGDWKDMPIHEMFIKIGRAGFELVLFDGEQYIFKRPAQNGSS